MNFATNKKLFALYLCFAVVVWHLPLQPAAVGKLATQVYQLLFNVIAAARRKMDKNNLLYQYSILGLFTQGYA